MIIIKILNFKSSRFSLFKYNSDFLFFNLHIIELKKALKVALVLANTSFLV